MLMTLAWLLFGSLTAYLIRRIYNKPMSVILLTFIVLLGPFTLLGTLFLYGLLEGGKIKI